MQTLASLVVILVSVSLGSAAVNRSTIWLISDELIYSTAKGYQYCDQLGSTANKSLVTTSYYRIGMSLAAGSVDTTSYNNPGAATSTGSSYIMRSLQVSFISTDPVTPNLVFNLPLFYTLTGNSYSAASANVLAGGSGLSSVLTNVIVPGTYSTASGSTWLTVRALTTYNTPTATTLGTADKTLALTTISYSSVLITDYKSSTTMVITQYQDGDDGTVANTDTFNHLYSVIVRTPTSLLTTSTDILVGGCSTPATRTANPGTKVTTFLGTCSVSSASDSSLSGSNACSDSVIPDAVTVSVSAMNSLRLVDSYVFGAAGSKFSIAANFGILIAISSIIFSSL